MRKSWPICLLVVAGYVALSILSTWPLAAHFSTALPGDGADSWQYLWNFWWFDQALFHGQPLYFTHAQYYPQGTSLLFHTLSPLNSVLGLPARLVGGYLAAYNLVVLLSTALSGSGTYLLALEVLHTLAERAPSRFRAGTGPAPAAGAGPHVTAEDSLAAGGPLAGPCRLAAFLAGAVFALSPYRSVHLLGLLSLVSTETLPFFALFAWRTVRRPSWRPALGMALAWLVAMLVDCYYPLYMALLAAFFLTWTFGEVLRRRRAVVLHALDARPDRARERLVPRVHLPRRSAVQLRGRTVPAAAVRPGGPGHHLR